MDTKERADNFKKHHPKYSPLVIHNNRLYGFWVIGRWYASDRGFYGSYPPSYLSRVLSLFPDCERILHLFSGTLQKSGDNEVTYDINPELNPDVCDDARNLLNHFQENEFDLILADPPYDAKDFEVYGCEPFDKKEVIKKCAHIVKPSGFLVWLDTRFPQFSRKYWDLFGAIGLVQSTNHRVRVITIFQKPRQQVLIRPNV